MQTGQIIEQVGKKYRLSNKEANDLFYYYWKELILKNLCEGDYEELHVLGLGKFRYSSNKLLKLIESTRLKKSEEYTNLLNKLYTNLETTNARRKWKK